MSAEAPKFSRERKVRMPDRTYDDHLIGDHCTVLPTTVIIPQLRESWKIFRYRGLIDEQITHLSEFVARTGGHAESIADFGVGSEFNPDSYPHGTVLFIGMEADKYSTTKWFLPQNVNPKRFTPPLPPEEEYDDTPLIRGKYLGVVMKFPNNESNEIMRVLATAKDIVGRNPKGYVLIDGPIPIGPWGHLLGLNHHGPSWHQNQMSPLIPLQVYGNTQNDIFYRYDKIEVLEWGKGIKEKAKKPLERFSEAIRREYTET